MPSAMKSEIQTLLNHVRRAADALIHAGMEHEGLFPSIIDRQTGQMMLEPPPAIPGQRDNDRSFHGSNLMHDQAMLATLRAMDELDPGYRAAADRYINRFALHCTNTGNGLFPWGEHAYWHLTEDRIGNSYEYRGGSDRPIHDHLRACPQWLWHALSASNPQCVKQFARGLQAHWIPSMEGQPREYGRHAFLDTFEPFLGSYPSHATDFPRHSGFYIHDWAFACTRSPDEHLLLQIRDMLDYWWNKRDANGLLLIQSREKPGHAYDRAWGVSQTLSLAASLLEASQMLMAAEPVLANTMQNRAQVYIDGFFNAPHDTSKGDFMLLWHPTREEATVRSQIWGSQYGAWPVCYTAIICLCVHRLTGDERLLSWAAAAGQRYQATPLPQDVHVPAMDAGLALELMADLYEQTHDRRWLSAGMALAQQLSAVYFDDASLPRGAAGIHWYESQMGPGFLLHGMLRMALLSQDLQNCRLPADYTCR